MWDLPRPGLEPVSPAWAGRFSTAAPPGKPQSATFLTPGTGFVEDSFSTGWEGGNGSSPNASDGGNEASLKALLACPLLTSCCAGGEAGDPRFRGYSSFSLPPPQSFHHYTRLRVSQLLGEEQYHYQIGSTLAKFWLEKKDFEISG